MRKFNRLLIFFTVMCAFCAMSFFVSCKRGNVDSGGGYFPADEDKAQIVLSDTVLEIESGDERELTVSLYNVDDDVVWTSGDMTIATVNNGLITAIKDGKTTISATCGELSASCEVTVKKSTAAPVIKTNFDEITMEIGDTVTISASVYRKNKLVDANVRWSIDGDDAESFTATENEGKFVVSATAGGKKAIVFASTELNGIKAYKSIEVTSVESGSIGKAEFIEETIKNLPDEISAMTVAEVSSLPELFDGYDTLGDDEKNRIDAAVVSKLNALRNAFSTADWKYLLNEKTTLNSIGTSDAVGEMPAYVTEGKVVQGENSAFRSIIPGSRKYISL